MDTWLKVLLIALAGLVLIVAVLYFAARSLQKREPYATFVRLRSRQKVRFFRMLATAPGLPRRVKVLPLLLAVYLASPIDLVPDFIPVLGYVDDVAIVLGTLALIVRWTPRPLIEELLARARESG